MLSVAIPFLIRALLVGLFLPFSALDKILNFTQALAQARQRVPRWLAPIVIAGGFGIEITMSAAILTGFADRFAALILAGYCIITALVWKQFWTVPGFRLKGAEGNRALFWDFLKNLALAGGFLLLTFGTNGPQAERFLMHPLSSSQPYREDGR